MRRALPALALVVLLVASGCLGGGSTGTDVPETSAVDTPTQPTAPTPTTTADQPTTARTTTEDDNGRETTTTRDRHDRWLRGDVVEVPPEEVARRSAQPLSEVYHEYRPIFGAAIENGSVTRTLLVEPPNSTDGHPIRVEETYYRLEGEVLRERQVRVHNFELDTPPAQSVGGDPVAFESLSPVDKRIVREGAPPAEERDDLGGFRGFYTIRFANGTAPNSSQLVEKPTLVRFENRTYSIAFDGTRTETQRTYRYTSAVVADSWDAWKQLALQRHVTNLSEVELNGTARQRLQQAVVTGSINYHSPNPSVPAWVDELRLWLDDHNFVEYHGQVYRLDIYYVME